MYDGPTGTSLLPSTCNTTGTLFEYPLVADVDNDGRADIVVASNAYVYAVVDDGMPAHVWHECRTDNDTSDAKSGKCQAPK